MEPEALQFLQNHTFCKNCNIITKILAKMPVRIVSFVLKYVNLVV